MATVKQAQQNDAKRSAFLDKASQSLIAGSPAVSAFLGSLHLRSSKTEAGNVQRCLSCGTVLIHSRTCRRVSTIQKHHVKGRKPDATPIRYRCTTCGALSALDRPTRQNRSSERPLTSLPTPKRVAENPAVVLDKSIEANNAAQDVKEKTTSKKRARPRKTGGLGALLAQSKSQQPKSPGLDLMDFMSAG